MRKAEGLAVDYLEQMKTSNPRQYSRSTGVVIDIEKRQAKGLRKLLGGEENGYNINVSLLKE